MGETKITVKIFSPLLKAFDDQVGRLYLKRDAFLNHIIKQEVPHLAEDMDGRRLSANARRYVSGQLKRMGTTTVNIVVDKETADSLNDVIRRANMVRDAFLNRLIVFLRSSNALLKYLELPAMIVRSEFESLYEEMPTSPLAAIETVFGDPLYYLRLAADERFKTGLYLLDLPPKLIGFSCFLEDAQVPGTKDHAARSRMVEEMMKELEALESDTPSGDASVGQSAGEAK